MLVGLNLAGRFNGNSSPDTENGKPHAQRLLRESLEEMMDVFNLPDVQGLLTGKIALVTGGGRGNGAAIAAGLASAGAKVIVTDIDEVQAKATAQAIAAKGGTSIGLQHNVADATRAVAIAAEAVFHFGALDILVNNAEILLRGKIVDVDARDKWEQTLRVNVDGPFFVTQAFVDQLGYSHGCIVNVASMQSIVASPVSAAYAASKGALTQLTVALATELAPFGIRVNAIASGAIETDMTAGTRESPETSRTVIEDTPMRHLGQPQGLVGPVLFLASPLARFVTGTVLSVGGGILTM
jgi:NAD(P)-dependent dehydrogenase (short-subunit alcohol dehydrogenase family)